MLPAKGRKARASVEGQGTEVARQGLRLAVEELCSFLTHKSRDMPLHVSERVSFRCVEVCGVRAEAGSAAASVCCGRAAEQGPGVRVQGQQEVPEEPVCVGPDRESA